MVLGEPSSVVYALQCHYIFELILWESKVLLHNWIMARLIYIKFCSNKIADSWPCARIEPDVTIPGIDPVNFAPIFVK